MQQESHDDIQVGQTHVSQPRVQVADSAQSVAASEDYYSLASSSENSVVSSHAISAPIRRYQTPPSRYRTPMASHERLPRGSVEGPTASSSGPMHGEGRRRSREPPSNRQSWPNQSKPREHAILRKPVPSTVYETKTPMTTPDRKRDMTMSSAAQEIGKDPHPPTPGIDNTPYIHFALDQLTRDEDVRGSRVYPIAKLGGSGRPGSYGGHRAAYTPLTIPQSKVAQHSPERVSPVSPISSPSLVTDNRPISAISELEPEPRLVEEPIQQRHSSPPAKHASRPASSALDLDLQHRDPRDVLLAFEGLTGVPAMSLRYKPRILRPLALISLLLILVLFLTELLFTAIWSRINSRLWTYSAIGDSRYFVFQYLPTLLGMIILVWLFEVQKAIIRIAPFIAYSSKSTSTRSRAALLPMQPSGFFLPFLVHFSADQSAIGAFLLAAWLFLFSVPLLATCFNVYQVDDVWVWLATQGVIWTVIVLYMILIIALIWLLVFLRRRDTGLKWDPVSIADILVLFESSNVLDLNAQYFLTDSPRIFRDEVAARGDRLGYWRTSTRPNAPIHAIAAAGLPVREHETDNRASMGAQRLSGRSFFSDTSRRSDRRDSSLADDSAQHRWQPWFLSRLSTFSLVAIFLILLLAFLVVSFLPLTAIHGGFTPDIPIPVNVAGFSSANFLYSFIPSLLGLLLFLLWTHIDLTLRRLQPISNLSRHHGAKPEHSLLLSYVSDLPLLVSLRALFNRDFRVAITSFISLIATTLPILGGGVFWAQFYIPEQTVKISGDMSAFYAVVVFFTLSCLGFLVLPFSKRRAERYSVPTSPIGSVKENTFNKVVDVIALFYQSSLLHDAGFRGVGSRVQMVTRLLTSSHINSVLGEKRRSQIISAASHKGLGSSRAEGGDAQASQRLNGADPVIEGSAPQQRIHDEHEHVHEHEHRIDEAVTSNGRYKLGKIRARNGKMEWCIDREEKIHAEQRGVKGCHV